eukprot:9740901-Alexandrium_andersonii.AAC.1
MTPSLNPLLAPQEGGKGLFEGHGALRPLGQVGLPSPDLQDRTLPSSQGLAWPASPTLGGCVLCVVCCVWCVVCGVWCGVWCVSCGVRCAVCGVRCVVCGAWRVARGAWRVARGAWCVARGAW